MERGNDPIPLRHIKQIPGVEGVVWALHDVPAGDDWPERILEVKAQADRYGLHIDVVEKISGNPTFKMPGCEPGCFMAYSGM